MPTTPTPPLADTAGEREALPELRIGDRAFVLERPSALKATRAMAMLRNASGAVPTFQRRMAEFKAKHRAENAETIDRVSARIRFAPRPYLDANGDLAIDDDGAPRLMPSPLDVVSESEWERNGHQVTIPGDDPDDMDTAVEMFELAVELAEEHVYGLLALFTLSNDEVRSAHRSSNLSAAITARVEWLEDNAYGDELIDLAAHIGRMLDEQFVSKARRLRGHLGKLLGGRTPDPATAPAEPPTVTVEPATSDASDSSAPSATTSTESTPSSSPSSSTVSAASTEDGGPTTSSTPTTDSSSSSTSSSPATTPNAPWTSAPMQPGAHPVTTPPTSDPTPA